MNCSHASQYLCHIRVRDRPSIAPHVLDGHGEERQHEIQQDDGLGRDPDAVRDLRGGVRDGSRVGGELVVKRPREAPVADGVLAEHLKVAIEDRLEDLGAAEDDVREERRIVLRGI